MELSYDSQEELIAYTCEECIGKFPQLKGAKFVVALRLPVNELANSVLNSLKMEYYPDSIFSRGIIVSSANSRETLIEMLHVCSEITIKSFRFNYDDPAIWIGNKLERYLKTNIIVRDPKKIDEAKNKSTAQNSSLNAPTVVREVIKEVVLIPCSYCGSLMPQTSVFCPNCGARRKH